MERLLSRAALRCTLLCTLLVGIGSGCSGSEEAAGEPSARQARAERARRAASVDLRLAPTDAEVKTVQLYRTGNETALPVLPLVRGETLTLELDLLTERSRPLSVYFYHADRVWRRDLSPSEYLESFQRDDLLDYHMSLATEVPYVHYTYSFPNNTIEFRLSGNYVVRVTEQGDEEAVLLERAFFVTEQAASLDFATDQVLIAGAGFPAVQPIAAFRPPSELQGNVFDYNVCFVRNGRFELARCTDRPSLGMAPTMQFYLDPEQAFEPEGASFFLDLGVIDVGSRIARTDRTTSPYQVVLEPDYARFGTTGIAPLLNGQSVVSTAVRGVGQADTEAQYVSVRFTFVPPDEQPLSGDVIVSGSFTDWQVDPSHRLTWMPADRNYQGTLLLKQGQYEYRYTSRDRRLDRILLGSMPRAENHYAAFVYYRDISAGTDRLIAVQDLVR